MIWESSLRNKNINLNKSDFIYIFVSIFLKLKSIILKNNNKYINFKKRKRI